MSPSPAAATWAGQVGLCCCARGAVSNSVSASRVEVDAEAEPMRSMNRSPDPRHVRGRILFPSRGKKGNRTLAAACRHGSDGSRPQVQIPEPNHRPPRTTEQRRHLGPGKTLRDWTPHAAVSRSALCVAYPRLGHAKRDL